MPRNVLLLFVLMLLATQLPVLATGGRPATFRQATPTSAWERVDTGPFSVSLPPGWKYVPQQGIDSFVGEFVGPDVALGFDYGAFSSRGPEPGAPGYEVLHEDIDSRPADIWVARADPADETALYVDYVGDPDSAAVAPTRLSLGGVHLMAAQQDVALAIMRSLRFKRVIPEQGRWEVEAELPNTSLVDLELLGNGVQRVSGAYKEAGSTEGVGVVYDLLDGVWQRQTVSDTYLVSGLSGDWAVAYGGQRVLHRAADGAWHTAVSDSPGSLFDLQDLHSEVWAVGIGALLHFDGTAWSTASTAHDGLSIDLVSEDEGWTAGARTLNQRTGGVWHTVPWPAPVDGSVPADASILAVDTISPREAWFAGNAESTNAGLLLHWHDGDWNFVADVPAHDLWGIDLVSPAEGWAVGGATSGGGPCEVLRYRDGSWLPQADVCIGHLHTIKVAPDGTTWAVGYRRTAENTGIGLVLRYVATVAPTWPSLYVPVADKTD